MSVEPGFSGQQFLPETEQRLDQLMALLRSKQQNYTLALDGGITQENIARLARKGVTQFAVAQAIFGQPDPVRALQNLESI
jgi:ribulose-phosphate 3-epimerase